LFTAATTAPTPVQAPEGILGSNQYRVVNTGSVVVFLGAGPTAAQATTNSAVITTSGAAIPLLPGTDEILSFATGWYFTGTTASGTAQVFITPGDGV
jgi:hypothetical protein